MLRASHLHLEYHPRANVKSGKAQVELQAQRLISTWESATQALSFRGLPHILKYWYEHQFVRSPTMQMTWTWSIYFVSLYWLLLAATAIMARGGHKKRHSLWQLFNVPLGLEH